MANVAYPLYTGANATLKQLAHMKAFMPDAFAKALYQEAQVELKEIKQVTPVDTGALRASERVTEPQREGRRIWVTIEAGGPAAPYAFIVHEDLEAFHKVGEAKYIERPLAEAMPYIPDRIAKRIDMNEAVRA